MSDSILDEWDREAQACEEAMKKPRKPFFGMQKGYCQTCGDEFKWSCHSGYENRVCSKECWKEYKWREVLSIMGKEYEMDPTADGTAKWKLKEWAKNADVVP